MHFALLGFCDNKLLFSYIRRTLKSVAPIKLILGINSQQYNEWYYD